MTDTSEYDRKVDDYLRSSKLIVPLNIIWAIILIANFAGFVLVYKYLCFDMPDSDWAKFLQNPFWSAPLIVIGPAIATFWLLTFGIREKENRYVTYLLQIAPVIILVCTFAMPDAMKDQLTADGMTRLQIMLAISLVVHLVISNVVSRIYLKLDEARREMHSLLGHTDRAIYDHKEVRNALANNPKLKFSCTITHHWTSKATRNELEWSTVTEPVYGTKTAEIRKNNGTRYGGDTVGYISYRGQTGTKTKAVVSGSHKVEYLKSNSKKILKTNDLLEAFREFERYGDSPGYTLDIRCNHGASISFRTSR